MLFIVLAGTTFFVSYVGTRLSMHHDVSSETNQYARVADDIVYAVTVALPASISPSLKMKLSLPHWHVPAVVWPALANAMHPQAVQTMQPKATKNAGADVDAAAIDREDDDSDAKLAKEPLPGEIITKHIRVQRKAIAHHAPVRHTEMLTGMIESQGKPLLPPIEMLHITTDRVSDSMLANVSAKRGGVLRFADGSYLSIGPNFLPHDTAMSVSLSAPALPETKAFDAASEAMIIAFKPVADGLAYADAPRTKTPGALAGIAVTNRQRMRLAGHMVTFVKRVFLADGTTTDFEENPSVVTQIMTVDLAEDHVLNFTAHYRGEIVLSLQRLKSSAVVGFLAQ